MAKFNILSIDGGGIRGIIPCRILQHIETYVKNQIDIDYSLRDIFDLVAGTSTGGIISLGLSAPNPLSANELLDIYVKHGNDIFHKRKQDFWSWVTSRTSLNKLTQYYYNADLLEKLLKQKLNNSMLSRCKTNVLITAFDITQNKPFYYLSRLAKDKDPKYKNEDAKLTDIARATSAAPTYFLPKIQNPNTDNELILVDGGVMANNPSVLAYCEAKEIWKRRHTLTFDPHPSPSDNDFPFFMLSIGTGNIKQSLSYEDVKEYRTKDWIHPLLSILMDGVSKNSDYSMHHLLPPYKDGTERYIRINVDVPIEYGEMDNASPQNINALYKIADNYVNSSEGQKLLYRVCNILGKR